MRLKDLAANVAQLRRQCTDLISSGELSRGDLNLRVRDFSSVISDMELLVAEAELAQDPLASHIYRSRQQLRKIVDTPRKSNLKPVRDLAERSYSQACQL